VFKFLYGSVFHVMTDPARGDGGLEHPRSLFCVVTLQTISVALPAKDCSQNNAYKLILSETKF